jgi:WD40 repeat protein
MAIMKRTNSAIGIDTEGHISQFDFGREIDGFRIFSSAHNRRINAVSIKPNSNDRTFVTSSTDRRIMLWDLRMRSVKSAITLYESCFIKFHGIHWCSKKENKGLVMIGGSMGYIYTIDIRQPGMFVSSIQVCNNLISKIVFNG